MFVVRWCDERLTIRADCDSTARLSVASVQGPSGLPADRLSSLRKAGTESVTWQPALVPTVGRLLAADSCSVHAFEAGDSRHTERQRTGMVCETVSASTAETRRRTIHRVKANHGPVWNAAHNRRLGRRAPGTCGIFLSDRSKVRTQPSREVCLDRRSSLRRYIYSAILCTGHG